MIPLAIVAADAVTTSVGMSTGAEEANPALAGLPVGVVVVLGVLASLLLCQLLRRRDWLRAFAMVWLAAKGLVVASNLAVLTAVAS